MTTEVKDVFWLELREPGCVPERKGPFPHHTTAAHLREFMKARPTALISVISWASDGPLITDAPETLQMLDGRSMSTGRRHIATSNADAAESRATAAEGRVALLKEERDEMTVAANDYAHQAAKAMLRERELSETLAAFVQRFELYAGPNDMHAGKHDLELLTLGRARLAKGGQ